ncbi:MAG: sugar phosphate isomerase/epimerase [Ruminococcaceae bacterium]|nr:sugar phosphate isomerase/epimerase [Oscillospiraceae bacterium]
MAESKLILNLNKQLCNDEEELIGLYKRIGFDGFFSTSNMVKNLKKLKKAADKENMFFQSVHAPFNMAAHLWRNDKIAAEKGLNELVSCAESCSDISVPLMIVHPYIGFDKMPPNETGVENYGRLINRAETLGVTVVFENLEREEFLILLMERFKNNKNVGFCWDTGHQMCYNGKTDLISLFGDRLKCVHLNDNLGVRNESGEITPSDDLHFLPFDGIADWNYIAEKLKKHSFTDTLVFELKINGDTDTAKEYASMGVEAYLEKAYERACRVRDLVSER